MESKYKAVMSYTKSDNDGGKLTEFRKRLSTMVELRTGEAFPIFHTEDVPWGQNPSGSLAQAINQATFFLPIMTPSFLRDQQCVAEMQQFIAREQQQPDTTFILPVQYIAWNFPTQWDTFMQSHRPIDWGMLRFEDINSPMVEKKLDEMAEHISTIMFSPKPTPTPVANSVDNTREQAPAYPTQYAHEQATQHKASIFLSYAPVDEQRVLEIYDRLRAEGHTPWMESEDLLPGETKTYSIRKAIKDCHFFLVLLSKRAVNEQGPFHKDLKMALDILDEKPEGRIYLIPVRLEDDCTIPERLSDIQPIDIVHERGWKKLLKAIETGMQRRS